MVIVESMNIEVELYGIPVVGHKSFGDAIKAGLSAPVALRAKADSALIAGQRVVEACWDWNEAAFLLSGGSSLRIFSSDGYCDWRIEDAAAYTELRSRLPSHRVAVVARFVTAAGEAEALNDCRFSARDLVKECVGKEVLRIGVRHTSLCFQFRGTCGWFVFFEPVKRHDNGDPLLMWVEDRD